MSTQNTAAVLAIDAWCNPFTPEWLQRLYVDTADLKEMVDRWGQKMRDRITGHDVRDFLCILDAANVESVLIPAFQMMSYRTRRMNWDIRPIELLPLLQEAPNRFLGLFGINPLDRMDGVRQLERAVADFGFKGAHLHPGGFALSPGDRAFYPYYAKCVELDIPVVIQTGHSAELMPSRYGQPIELDEVALYFPGLRIVAAHLGWPWVEELIALAWKHPNVYIATTGHLPRYWDESVVRFLNSRGQGKVMWGTDFPVVTHADSLNDIERLGLKPTAKQLLLRGVAKEVFRI